MDSFELNKIIGAVLGTLLFVMGVGFIAEAIYEPIETEGLGLELPEAEGTGHAGGEEVEVAVADIGMLLAASDTATGEGQARKCQSCHSFQEGGPNGQGPNLWGIVERPVASHEGFTYSDAMKAHAAESPTWTYAELNAFILAPKDHVPGTKMNFGGVKNDEERANIIAYLSTLAASPVPFPAPAAPAAEEAAPAEGATPAAEGAEPTPAEAAPTEPATETQGETPVQGTATGSNTPAGAETPAAGGDVPVTTPAEPAPTPTATIEQPPAPSGTITPAEPPPPTTTAQ
jgi:cytochrome c